MIDMIFNFFSQRWSFYIADFVMWCAASFFAGAIIVSRRGGR